MGSPNSSVIAVGRDLVLEACKEIQPKGLTTSFFPSREVLSHTSKLLGISNKHDADGAQSQHSVSSLYLDFLYYFYRVCYLKF